MNPVTLLTGVLSGVAGATVTMLMISGPSTNQVDPMANEDSYASELKELRAETKSLRDELQSLNLEIASLGGGPVKREPVDGFVSKREFEALARKMDDQVVLGGQAGTLEARVEQVVENMEERERQERRERKREERIQRVSGWLDLDEGQTQLYGEFLTLNEQAEERFELAWEAGNLSDEEAGQMKRDNRLRHLENVASMLNPQQTETFNEWMGRELAELRGEAPPKGESRRGWGRNSK